MLMIHRAHQSHRAHNAGRLLQTAARICELAAGLGLRQVEGQPEDAPFDVSPVKLPRAPQSGPGPQAGSCSSGGGGGGGSGEASVAEYLAAAEAAVAAQAGVVRALKEGGRTNQDPEVQAGVQVRAVGTRLAGGQDRLGVQPGGGLSHQFSGVAWAASLPRLRTLFGSPACAPRPRGRRAAPPAPCAGPAEAQGARGAAPERAAAAAAAAAVWQSAAAVRQSGAAVRQSGAALFGRLSRPQQQQPGRRGGSSRHQQQRRRQRRREGQEGQGPRGAP
jgi:hypothetical protein